MYTILVSLGQEQKMTRKEYQRAEYERIRGMGYNMLMSWWYARWNTKYKYPEL